MILRGPFVSIAHHHRAARDDLALRAVPAVPQTGNAQEAAICRAEVVRDARRLVSRPFEEPGCGNDAAAALEGVPEHRAGIDALDPRVEGRGHLPENFLPPRRHEPPSGADQLPAVFTGNDDVHIGRRRDVVARLEVAATGCQRQRLAEGVDLLPSVVLREASAHGEEHTRRVARRVNDGTADFVGCMSKDISEVCFW